jgi:thymidylate synthase
MIQEIISRTLGTNLGIYRHFVGSLHIYDSDYEAVQDYLNEGFQRTTAMPAMPKGDPWPALQVVLDAESDLRFGRQVRPDTWRLKPYWRDVVRLLQIYALSGKPDEIEAVRRKMTHHVFEHYSESRKKMKPRTVQIQQQLSFNF